MSRRPLLDTVQLSLQVPRGEAGFWSIIRDLDSIGSWTVRQVHDRTNVDVTMVARFVRKLRLGGYAELVGSQANGLNGRNIPAANTYRLKKRPVLVPRLDKEGRALPETANEQLWRAMKMTKAFTPAELAELCPDVSVSAAKGYSYALTAAGVLSHRQGTFRLLRNLGNQAPKILATKLVFDPNTGQVLGPAVAREVSR